MRTFKARRPVRTHARTLLHAWLPRVFRRSTTHNITCGARIQLLSAREEKQRLGLMYFLSSLQTPPTTTMLRAGFDRVRFGLGRQQD